MGTVLTKDGLKDYEYGNDQELPIKCSWSILRNAFTIEEGVTYGDLLSLIENDPFLHFFMVENYPLWDSFTALVQSDQDHYPIQWTGQVKNGRLRFYSHPLATTPDKHLPLKLYPDLQVTDAYGKEYQCGQYSWSFLEVLESIFKHCKRQESDGFILKPEGLWHPNLGWIEDGFGYLVQECDVEHGVTLQNMFDFVSKHEDVKDFIRFYSWCYSIEDFHKEAKNSYDSSKDEEEPFVSINVKRVFKFNKHRDKDPWKIKNYIDMDGCKDNDLDRYAMEYTPVNELAHLPLCYNNAVDIKQEVRWSRNANIKEPEKLFVKCVYPYTLIEVLDAIYDEISYCGDPKQRDAKFGMLKDRLEDYMGDNDLEDE